MKQNDYSDGTPITFPFFICTCPNGHTYWSVTPQERCSRCGNPVECRLANDKKETTGN
nr:MAG TPA: Putative toxin VapC6 domain, ZN ribbon domain [Caudoviricetes sp.]